MLRKRNREKLYERIDWDRIVEDGYVAGDGQYLILLDEDGNDISEQVMTQGYDGVAYLSVVLDPGVRIMGFDGKEYPVYGCGNATLDFGLEEPKDEYYSIVFRYDNDDDWIEIWLDPSYVRDWDINDYEDAMRQIIGSLRNAEK